MITSMSTILSSADSSALGIFAQEGLTEEELSEEFDYTTKIHDPIAQAHSDYESSLAASHPLRIIVAEDEALIRLDLVEMLAEENYEVVAQVDNGQKAVDLTYSLCPDLVIMDIKMPVRDGLDAAKEITEKNLAPVIILTAFSQREFINRAKDSRVIGYLVKPFSKSDLVPAIEIAVGKFREMNALYTQVHAMQEKIKIRKVVERAKGMLMTEQGLSEMDAFKAIQKEAMDRRVTMLKVALEVIEKSKNIYKK